MELGFAPLFLMLFGGIWGLVGTIILVVFNTVGAPVWDDWILDSRGVRAMATPVRSTRTSTRINRVFVYEVTWQARDAAGVPRQGTVRTVGDRSAPFEVEYDPQRVERARPVGGSASVFGWFMLIPGVFALVGWTLALGGATLRARLRALYRDGTVAQGQVVSFEGTSMRVNRKPVHRVGYTWSTPAGMMTATSTTMAMYAPGSDVWVIYDPARPERAMLA